MVKSDKMQKQSVILLIFC